MDSPAPTTAFRLERRFVLQAIGTSLLIGAIALVVAMAVPVAWVQILALVLTLVMIVRAVWLWFTPPTVVLLDDEGVTIGGPLTVKPIHVPWPDVQDVSHDGHRLLLDRGGDTLLAFPLTYVGGRATELVRALHAALNEAHGYRRFDPDTD